MIEQNVKFNIRILNIHTVYGLLHTLIHKWIKFVIQITNFNFPLITKLTKYDIVISRALCNFTNIINVNFQPPSICYSAELMNVFCYMLYAICYMLCVIYVMCFVLCYVLYVTCYVLCVIRYTLYVIRYMFFLIFKTNPLY